uniref:OSJNBa0023J03.20 protein n=1 Tax=Oryza sativa subsp. japonica TaxID=39947 RepID=Q7X6H3_ORYSJ|nr:OSJNBa0023J03.20 [Oryza sativa Japonica Group]CAE02406.2 OSJNBa0024J22.10 [Oryza sativa Japonica Group]
MLATASIKYVWMSGDMPIRLYYGNAHIQICDSGVDLTVYVFYDTSLNAPEHMGSNDLLGWLYNMFEVDPVLDKFVINAMWPVRGQHGWQWRVVEVALTGSWRKFVSKVREKGYSLTILVWKTTFVDRSGESSHAVVEETPLEGAQVENVWRTEQGQREEVVEGNTQAEVIVRDNNREANDSDDEELDSPMRVDAAEENEAPPIQQNESSIPRAFGLAERSTRRSISTMGTPISCSEPLSDYLRRKDEYDRRKTAESLQWQVNLLGLPTWRERPECRSGDRCQVIRSIRQQTLGQRCFVCPNIVDDDFVEEDRKCSYVKWIDTVRRSSIGSTITQPETTTQFIQAWMEYEHQVQSTSLHWRSNPLGIPEWSDRPKCGCRDRCQVATSFSQDTYGRRYFVCPNIDDFVGNPRMCAFTSWIDMVSPTYESGRVTEDETQTEYKRLKDHEVALCTP